MSEEIKTITIKSKPFLPKGVEKLGEEKDKKIERLNNIIKRFEEDLREVYLTFGEFSEEYTENRIKELKGESNEKN